MRRILSSDAPSDRARDLTLAVRISLLTIAWNAIAGGAAVVTALAIGSLALVGFGLSAALDSVASAALVWRFTAEGRDPTRGHQLESLTVRLVGGTLIAVASFVCAQAARSLWAHTGPRISVVAVSIAALSVLVLPPLAVGKFRLAGRLGSRALRGDGMLTAMGAALAVLTLVGLVLDDLLGWWWTDAGAALIISILLAREGVLTLRQAD